MNDDTMTVGSVARATGLSVNWVRYLVDSGKLQAKRGTLGERRIRRETLEAYMRAREARRRGSR